MAVGAEIGSTRGNGTKSEGTELETEGTRKTPAEEPSIQEMAGAQNRVGRLGWRDGDDLETHTL